MICAKTPEGLPAIAALKRISQGLATLDAMLCEEWDMRYYSFNARWNAAGDQQMASMRDGSGDEYVIWFAPEGAVIKGFGHESPMSPASTKFVHEVQAGVPLYPGLLDGFPDALRPFLEEPAFALEHTTFVLWRLASDDAWHRGSIQFPENKDPDGSTKLLGILAGEPALYVDFASDYFEANPDIADVARVLALEPLDDALLQRLGATRTLEQLADDLAEIGYSG